MKLKSLQIKGFKSFANETTIHFNDEIIGIVGPNGSGKSNIVDSIRWALGEQRSKDLRLEKMVDVIFNGTKTKRKSGMAQVSMTFENSKKLIPIEYDIVKVSRILYDTNESEYRINDVPCRLKDVRDLFIDTGIGSNSYAIIELGMVDDILVDKEHSRRRMFEQAAGIAKYKIRKREASLKLISTQTDLDRIEDILFELTASMKSLERQAKRTKKYYELKEYYKELSIKKAIVSQSSAIDEEQVLKVKMQQENDKLVKVTAETHALEAEIEKIKKSNLDSEQALSAKQKEFNQIMDLVRNGESQKEIKKQNALFLEQNIRRAAINSEEYDKSIKEILSIVSKKSDQLDDLLQKGNELEKDYESWKSRFESIENKRKNIEGASSEQLSELKSLDDQKFELEKSIIEISSRLSNFAQNKQNALDEVRQLEMTIADVATEQDEINKSFSSIITRLEGLRKQKINLDTDKEIVNQKIATEKENQNGLNRKLDALSNEYNLLKDMVDSLEGFPESSKFLIKEWKKSKPVLSDIIECPDEYRGAIESYLDTYLSYFILDSVEEARVSIDLLKKAQKGRSQFFILSSFEEKVSRTQILFDHHGLPALEIVKGDKKYASLIQFLLQNVVLVEDDDVLRSDTLDEEVTYLSKNGSTNRTRHVISGGSIGLFDGKRIGRKKEINNLSSSVEKTKSEIQSCEKRINDLQGKLSSLFEIDFDNLINEELEKKNVAEVKKAELNAKINSAQNIIEGLNNRIGYFDNEDIEGINKVEKFKKELANLSVYINDKKQFIDGQKGQVEEISKKYSDINSAYNESHLNWVRHQNDLQNLQNEITFRQQQLKELESKKNAISDELNSLNENQLTNTQELKFIEEKLIKDYSVKKEKQEELNETEQAFFSNRSVINEKEDQLRQYIKESQNQQMLINDIKDKLTGIEFELRSALERLKIEFNIDLKTLSREDHHVEDDDIGNLMEQYEKTKSRIDKYGEINPLAVEAYDEILERHDSMKIQRDDILEARISLEETIKEIDEDATKKFLESFYKVKENFKEVFRSLFSSEDDCDLILFDPENPLNSDIEIVAKPKGKRPKVLSQLSGGEKTLTATALLFSLYLLKPAPFCIFDEVDAPLDDVNIQKFSKLIRKFSDQSQFIVITHNKSTMAAMDLLYGVYMQEQGVSGVTQVDFRDYEHDEIFRDVNV